VPRGARILFETASILSRQLSFRDYTTKDNASQTKKGGSLSALFPLFDFASSEDAFLLDPEDRDALLVLTQAEKVFRTLETIGE
jgi:hypothetical protein